LMLPHECRPKDRVLLDDVVPTLTKSCDIEVLPQRVASLLEVYCRILIAEAVEEHPLLHRRQRVDIFNRGVSFHSQASDSNVRDSTNSSSSSWVRTVRGKSDGV